MVSATKLFAQSPSPHHATGEDTRARLLAAATEVFLEVGFRAARVQDIAQRAGLRLSAINYHFESKEGLYLAVLRHHADKALAATPLQQPGVEQPVRARFDFAVSALVNRMLDPHGPSRIGQLMLRELTNPTPALEVLLEHFNLPQAKQFLTLLAEIVGPAVPHEALTRCLVSIFGQCAVHMAGRPMIKRLAPEIFTGEDVLARVTRHVADFSWAGLHAIRAQWEKPDAPG
ncbi:MAG: hypothetical protein H6R19_931 [Proteobacteria bacterium]|nr:hypothetical protein [Pseudomonadota bacterium]